MSPSERHAKALRARKCRQSLARIDLDDGVTFPQRQSPLFSKLPPELRLLIFEFTLSGYRNEPRIISDSHLAKHLDSFHPAYLHPLRYDTDLLLTCRLIYSEANHIPMKFAKFDIVRMPFASMAPEQIHPTPSFFAKFIAKNSAEMQEVEFCEATSYAPPNYFAIPQFMPKIITLSTTELTDACTIHSRTWQDYVGSLRDVFTRLCVFHFPSSCKRLNLRFECWRNNEKALTEAISAVGVQSVHTSEENLELSTEGNDAIFEPLHTTHTQFRPWLAQNMPWAICESGKPVFDTIVATLVLTPPVVCLAESTLQSSENEDTHERRAPSSEMDHTHHLLLLNSSAVCGKPDS